MSTAIQHQIVRRKLIRFSAFRIPFRLSPTHTIHPSFRTRPTIISLFISMLFWEHDTSHHAICRLSLFATPLWTETTALGHPQTLSHCNVMIPSVCHLSPGQLRMCPAPMDTTWSQFRNGYFDSSFTKAHSAETKAPHFFTWSSYSLNIPDTHVSIGDVLPKTISNGMGFISEIENKNFLLLSFFPSSRAAQAFVKQCSIKADMPFDATWTYRIRSNFQFTWFHEFDGALVGGIT